jgi:hypothetical protein
MIPNPDLLIHLAPDSDPKHCKKTLIYSPKDLLYLLVPPCFSLVTVCSVQYPPLGPLSMPPPPPPSVLALEVLMEIDLLVSLMML